MNPANADAFNDASGSIDRNLSVNEAAAYTGVSVAYLNRLRTTGGGPAFFKIGARVVYSPLDLNEWLAKHRRTSTSDVGQ